MSTLPSTRSRKTPWLIAVVFGVAAIALNALGSWIPSLWGDEAASLLSAERPLPSLFRMVLHVDAVHGLYYLGLHFWIQVAGTSPFALRFPSAIAIGIAVASLTLLAWRGGRTGLAITTGIVACLLPRLTYEGEEARSYPFTAANASVLTLLFVWLVAGEGRLASRRTRAWCWAAYGVGMALSSYLFLYFVTLLLAHLVMLACSHAPRSIWRAWLISSASACVSLAPLGLLAFFERSQIAYLGNTPLAALGLLYSIWFSTPTVAVISWTLIAAGIAYGGARWWRSRGVTPTEPQLSTVLTGTSWLFIPTGVLLIVNIAFPLYTQRYSTFAAPAAALLIAEGALVIGTWVRKLTRIPAVIATTACVLVFAGVAVPAYLDQRGPYSKNDSDWAEVSAAISRVAHPGDAVVFDEGARPSRNPRLAMRTYPSGFADVHDVTLKTPYYRNSGWADRAYTVPQAAALGRFDTVNRVWVIELKNNGVPDRYGLSALETLGFHETGVRVNTHREVLIEFVR